MEREDDQTTQEIIEAYCDGSIAPSTLEDSHKSRLSSKVGRVMVIIPSLDIGLVVQFYDNLELPNGHENSLYAEVIAIKQADSFCKEKGLESFEIYADNPKAIENARLTNVKPLDRSGRLNAAHEYLRSLLSYAGYSRGSVGAKRSRTSRKRLE